MKNSRNILKSNAVQSLIASLMCIILGLLIGYIVLLFINPTGAWDAIMEVMKNFMHYSKQSLRLKNFGNTLVKTAPLLMCSLSVLFAYKVGLFDIGAAGQYVVGVCASLYAALGWGWSWLPCVLLAIAAGAVYGAIVGVLKAYCNVNEVISGIMLNWIALYTTNMILTNVKETTSPYTFHIKDKAAQALLPCVGIEKFFNNNTYVTIAVPLSIVIAIIIAIILDKTKFGYELKATGNNKNAAKYCGMAEKRNIILTLMISGALAALGGALLYLTDYEQWQCTTSSVPGMGFNGIAAAFLGGLNPIGSIFSSYFIQHITTGGAYVDKTMYCAQISELISSLIIYLCGFVFFIKYAINKSIAKHEEKQLQKATGDAPGAKNTKGGKE
jgi:general nucleoside transport system permease protein